MANLWVIMTGLGVLVERKDRQQPGVVLMRNVFGGNEPLGGVNIPLHIPKLRRGQGKPDLLVPEFEIEFLPRSGDGAPTLEPSHRDHLLAVGNRLRAPGRVRDDLLTDQSLDRTTRVMLHSGSLEAIQIDKNFQLDGVSRLLNIQLVGLFDPERNRPDSLNEGEGKTIANGLLYKCTIQGNKQGFSVKIAGDEYPILRVPKEKMRNLKGNDDDHDDYVVWIVNVGDSPQQSDFDIDFALLYEWLERPVEVKHVPITKRQRANNTGQGDPPGQCMYGRVNGG